MAACSLWSENEAWGGLSLVFLGARGVNTVPTQQLLNGKQ